jgi:hypothetical protein
MRLVRIAKEQLAECIGFVIDLVVAPPHMKHRLSDSPEDIDGGAPELWFIF